MTMGRLDGKIALVTGSARGQGEAEVRRFAVEGARVYAADILDDLGSASVQAIGPMALR
jgi:3alpha(or 20beta)-hydroxysteroid dehydrogenase